MFYERLYSERQVEDCIILDMAQDIPKLTLQEKTSREREITLAETSFALKNLKNDKSPGSDGGIFFLNGYCMTMTMRLSYLHSALYRSAIVFYHLLL